MKTTQHRIASGFSLIEVMIAVVILSFGLLALATFHGALFRAGAEAKARATATALAQEVIEEGRAFAYLTKPQPAYTGATYMDTLTSFGAKTVSSGGVDYSITRTVKRLSATTGAEITTAFNPAEPEYKFVEVKVSWQGNDGSATPESVTIKDTIAAIAPADSMSVIKGPLSPMRGPEVRIEPPNKDNPAVVPIAVGDDKSAASSNPVPRRYEQVDSNTAATLFSVHTFTGSPDGVEVVLNRKLDVAGVTCRCGTGVGTGYQSTGTNPAYQPTVWNGKQLAYMEPLPLPIGTKVGQFLDKGQSAADIEAMCDTCCRDHHESASRTYRPDPHRPTDEFSAGAEHYFYTDLTKAIATGTYSEACQLIRVGGRMHVTIDPKQNFLLNVPLNSAGTGHEPANFSSRYSGLVVQYLEDSLADPSLALKSQAKPEYSSTYLSPDVPFPAFDETKYAPACDPLDSSCLTKSYQDILAPVTPIYLAKGSTKTIVSFGLYVDYLSPDTKKAYDCALNKATNTGDATCNGLRDRNALETLPFYAINVANLGVWALDTNGKNWLTVSSPTFDNKGILKGLGGVVTAVNTNAAVRCDPVTVALTRSSSGIAGRLPIDPDDNKASNKASDALQFTGSSAMSKCI
jgi:prepilin-type N-terminal cleavage/methylation domain-containing protein